MLKAQLILYVKDQDRSTDFYSKVLDAKPTLNVPGMTEFSLGGDRKLGLMPEKRIKELLGEALPDPSQASGVPRAELYLQVNDPASFHERALKNGATEISALELRNWGDIAAYSLDFDGHVLAFRKTALAIAVYLLTMAFTHA